MTECQVCEAGDYYDVVESRLMYMTMLAHRQALYDRIKKRIEDQEGEKLDKIADLLVQASEKSREEDRQSRGLKEKLRDIMEG